MISLPPLPNELVRVKNFLFLLFSRLVNDYMDCIEYDDSDDPRSTVSIIWQSILQHLRQNLRTNQRSKNMQAHRTVMTATVIHSPSKNSNHHHQPPGCVVGVTDGED